MVNGKDLRRLTVEEKKLVAAGDVYRGRDYETTANGKEYVQRYYVPNPTQEGNGQLYITVANRAAGEQHEINAGRGAQMQAFEHAGEARAAAVAEAMLYIQ